MNLKFQGNKKKQIIENKGKYKDTINIALAGNPNVGKSVILINLPDYHRQ